MYVSAGGICRLVCTCTLIASRCEMETGRAGRRHAGEKKRHYTQLCPRRLMGQIKLFEELQVGKKIVGNTDRIWGVMGTVVGR